jgi:hypothetical protein
MLYELLASFVTRPADRRLIIVALLVQKYKSTKVQILTQKLLLFFLNPKSKVVRGRRVHAEKLIFFLTDAKGAFFFYPK